MTTLQLIPHAATPCDFIRELRVEMQLIGDRLVLGYEVSGDVRHLSVPESRRSARTDGLWRATCFEIFLRPHGAVAYQEFNFSPSGEWAAYSFTDYRAGMAVLDLPQPPAIQCRATSERLEVQVHLQSPVFAHEDLRAALAAVLKHDDGAISYWALAHPQPQPDFHHAGGFAATLG